MDGSGWQGVYDVLKKDGCNVSIVQNPTTSLANDAVTNRMLAAQNGPAILVGHSYGGVVITEAGNDPKPSPSRHGRRSQAGIWWQRGPHDSPDAQRAMSKRAGSTVVEANGSHAIYVSQPVAVAALIVKAAHAWL